MTTDKLAILAERLHEAGIEREVRDASHLIVRDDDDWLAIHHNGEWVYDGDGGFLNGPIARAIAIAAEVWSDE